MKSNLCYNLGDGALLDNQDLIRNVSEEGQVIESRILRWSLKPAAQRYKVSGAQGDTKRCRLSLLTISALVYEPKCGGMCEGVAGSQPMSTAVHITWHGAQIDFWVQPPYLTYAGAHVLDRSGRRFLKVVIEIFFQIANFFVPFFFMGISRLGEKSVTTVFMTRSKSAIVRCLPYLLDPTF